jgi:hypothetical protein
MAQDAHKAAMEYVSSLFPAKRSEVPTIAATEGHSEDLDEVETYFMSKNLELLISGGGDKLGKDLILKDENSGDSYHISFIIEKVKNADGS